MNGHSNGSRGDYTHNGYRKPSLWQIILMMMMPGVGLKRWALLGALGVSICSVGMSYVARRVFDITPPEFLPGQLEGFFFMVVGIGSILLALYGFHRSFGPLFMQSAGINHLTNTIYSRHILSRGPKIVAIGGGTGLSVLLRGLKAYTDNLTAIVTVGDDGGSSGRLREELDILPPGDLRNCLVAMSDAEPILTELFQYRFDRGDGLKGHSFGNLFIAAMADVTQSFDEALAESSRVLAVHGRIIPSTMDNLRLSVQQTNGKLIHGESRVAESDSGIDRLLIDPPDAEAHPAAVEALRDADIIVIGPGSLYTSILPNLMVDGIARAVSASAASKVFVTNIATERGETEGYSALDHYDALTRHTFPGIVNQVVVNNRLRDLGNEFYGEPVRHNWQRMRGVRLHSHDLADAAHPVRHDSERLARAIMSVYHKRGGLRSLIGLGTN